MEFTQKETQKYSGVSEQDLKDFENRNVFYQSTQSSCLECENAILTLESEKIFYDGIKGFFARLNKSKKISSYTMEVKHSYFYKWLQKFLIDNREKNKSIRYVSDKVYLNHLKEASIILFNQETT